MSQRCRVYWSNSSRTYVIKCGTRSSRATRHETAHRYIAESLGNGFRFYFVFAQPDISAKTRAFLRLLEYMPDVKNRVGILVSYALIDDETMRCVKTLKEHRVEIMLDSGAFHVLEKKIPLQEFLSYIDDYIEFANRHIELFDWIVNADIPCDARPAESIQHMPNLWKIEKTVENAEYILERIADPRKFVAVVQGYHPHEYEHCASLLRERGIVTARMGVGSLCVRKYNRNERQMVPQILRVVKESLPAWAKLHAFGLNVRFLKHEDVVKYLSSSDSDAWVYSYSKFARLVLADLEGDFREIDLKDITRRGKKIELDLETIYFYLLLSYVMKLRTLGLI